jgi:predicted DNA-binding ribbon-helix-helix protein
VSAQAETSCAEARLHVPMYHGNIINMTRDHAATSFVEVERVQTGVRLEKRMLKVLKAVAELKDMSLGDLLEGVVLHAFEGKVPFSSETLKEIEQFKKIYGMTLKASDSHQLKERKR